MKHLTKYFKNPFSDTLNFFEKLEKEQKMVNVYGVNFKKKQPMKLDKLKHTAKELGILNSVELNNNVQELKNIR